MDDNGSDEGFCPGQTQTEVRLVTIDLQSTYSKYLDYVRCLRADLDRTSNKPIDPHFRVDLLSYSDFCHTWHRWGETEGMQEVWQRRFDQGYDGVAADLTERLTAAMVGGEQSASVPATQDAA